MELTIAELKKKRVVNLTDGKDLGRVVDVSFSYPDGNVTALIISNKKFGFGSKSLLKLCCIDKIGMDIILVRVTEPNPKQQELKMEEYE